MGALRGLVSEGISASSPLRPVSFDVTKDGISFLDRGGEGVVVLPYSSLRIKPIPTGRDGIVIRGAEPFPALYVKEASSIERLHHIAPAQLKGALQRVVKSIAPARVSKSGRAIVSLFMIALVAAVFYRWRYDLCLTCFTHLPPSFARHIGESVSRSAMNGQQVSSDPVLIDAVEHLVDPLFSGAQGGDATFKAIVFESNEVDAFAAPGPIVGVSTQLIASCHSPDEFLAVVAHEWAHIERRHQLEELASRDGWHAAPAVLAWTVNRGEQFAPALPRTLAHTSYSDEQEMEADNDAIAFLTQHGVDASGLAGFFERLGAVDGVRRTTVDFTLTHPTSLKRLMNARAAAGRMRGTPSWIQLDWRAVRARAQLAAEK